tara:strand:- start:140 stop:340 length:201 start_codon:yes stop_codon:yes gene_type:complete
MKVGDLVRVKRSVALIREETLIGLITGVEKDFYKSINQRYLARIKVLWGNSIEETTLEPETALELL